MENHHPRHKSNSSGDNFTFPAMSPDMEIESELADHLFFNGKLILHTFPIQPKNFTTTTGCTFSRTSSVSSKDSLVSSRSNSTNSRTSSSGSSCSSARTSISEASAGVAMKNRGIFSEKGNPRSPVHYCNNYYLPAQRWQFMAPVPVLNRRNSQRRKGGEEKRKGSSPEKKNCSRKTGYCQRIFRWIVSTCKRCHAMEP